MKNNRRNLILIITVAVIIFGLSLGGILSPDNDYSIRERRYLSTFPNLNRDTLAGGSFMEEFERYSYDQFPGRNVFLEIKSTVNRNVFMEKDDSGYYKVGEHLAKLEYPANYGKLEQNADRIKAVYDKYINGKDANIYLSLIPDKSYYLGKQGGYPRIDYNEFFDRTKQRLGFARAIDIEPLLDYEDYYKTDPHWKQEKIQDVADALLKGMNSQNSISYQEKELDIDFWGTYYTQSGIGAEADRINYLYDSTMDDYVVTGYDSGSPAPLSLYDFERAKGADAYEFFLSGPQAVVSIENKKATTDRELVIFRDSFGCSIAPLLAGAYSKITLIDLRYISSDFIGDFIEFDNQDVLFLYNLITFNQTIGR